MSAYSLLADARLRRIDCFDGRHLFTNTGREKAGLCVVLAVCFETRQFFDSSLDEIRPYGLKRRVNKDSIRAKE